MSDAALADRRSVVVGREAERARVDTFAAALPGGTRALVIRGEAGIGKTALWRHAVERCRAAGFHVLVTRPTEEEMPLALVGLVDLFEGDAAVLLAEDDPLARGRIVLDALRALAATRPVLVAIDDVQWLDSASARALRYALRRLDEEPIGVLATARLGVGEADPLAAASSLPTGRHEALDVGPLSLGALRGVLAGTVTAISRPALRRIHEVSAGNPLYAIELARAFGRDGGTERRPGAVPLPDSLQLAIVRRLETVPAELGPLLETAAALGPTPVKELRETQPGADVDRLVALAEEHGLLVVDEHLEVRFSHPLVGSAVYGRMSPLARRALHEGLAGRAADADVRARHLALSTDEPDAGVAALLEDASARASGHGVPELAAEFASHSLRLTPPQNAAAAHRRALAEIENLATAGQVRDALALADRLVARLPPGPDRSEALVQRADLEDDDLETAEASLVGALDDAGPDERLRGRVLDRLAELRRSRNGDLPGAIECAREALAIAERVGDARLEVHAAAYLAHLEGFAGTPRPELMARAVELEEEIGSPPLTVGPRALLAKHRRYAGDLPGARALLEAVHGSAVRAGREIKRPQHFYDLTLVECAAGNLAAAEELVREGIESARDAENTYAERELLHALLLVEVWLGRADDARATAVRLREEATRHGVRPLLAQELSLRGLLVLSEGDAAAAAPGLAEAARRFEEMGFAHPGAFRVRPDAIEALAQTGDTDAAGALFDAFERQAAAVEGAWASAAVERAGGILLLAHGDAEAALAPLELAVASFDRIGHRPDAARAVLAHGRALLRGGHRTVAADALADARNRFAAIGAVLWEARALEELERAAPGRAGGELTPAERRVAVLVAQGMKNREIAQALFMSVATVEAHLTRIYRKLEIRSRSELTRRVAEGSINIAAAEVPS